MLIKLKPITKVEFSIIVALRMEVGLTIGWLATDVMLFVFE